MMGMIRILWVEDQTHWIERFRSVLEAGDFDGQPGVNDVQVFRFAEAAKQYIASCAEAPDVALLDANMNGNDQAGFSVSRALSKKWPDLPVIYLSEHSGTGIEQQAFEETGAQDFIAKHQNNIEEVLCWRIRAVVRKRMAAQPGVSDHDTLVSGHLRIDTDTWTVYWHGEKLMNPTNIRRSLPPTPRKILKYLVEASPRPLTTLQIAELLDADPERFSNANYRQHIRTLRQSFEQAAESSNAPGFTVQCKQGKGITTFGDEGGYCWVEGAE